MKNRPVELQKALRTKLSRRLNVSQAAGLSYPRMYRSVCGGPFRILSTPQSGFLQIPYHDAHSWLQLTLSYTGSAGDFHYQVIAYSGHTKQKRQLEKKLALII